MLEEDIDSQKLDQIQPLLWHLLLLLHLPLPVSVSAQYLIHGVPRRAGDSSQWFEYPGKMSGICAARVSWSHGLKSQCDEVSENSQGFYPVWQLVMSQVLVCPGRLVFTAHVAHVGST